MSTINTNVAFVRTVFLKPGHLYPVTEPGEGNKPRTCAQLQVVRYDSVAKDFLWQVFGLGWNNRHGRVLLGGEANPHEFTTGNRLMRHSTLGRADGRVGENLKRVIAGNLKLIRGDGNGIPLERMNRPLAWHPTDLVDFTDVTGKTGVLIPSRVPGTEAFVVPRPQGLTETYEVIENLKVVTVDHTVVDLSAFQNWLAVDVDSLANAALGIKMVLSLAESDALHEEVKKAIERRRQRVEASRRVTARHASHPAPAAEVSEAAAEQVAASAAQEDGGVNPS